MNEPEQTRYTYKGIQGLIWSTCHAIITISKCFYSIRRLFWGNGGMPLPDDVVFDILSKLSASDALQCRNVCRGWMSLTSTPYFLEHLEEGSPPIILLHHYDTEGGGLKLYSVDLTPDVPCIKRFNTKNLQLDCFVPPIFGGTCDGLVLLWCRRESSFHLYICNPFTGKKIMEVAAEGFYFCGFWFQPVKREYFFLTASIASGGLHEYKIFNLRGERKVAGWYGAFPTGDVPTNINGSLYNLLVRPVPPKDCIMIFDIDSEKIEFGPHPDNGHCRLRHDVGRNSDAAGMRLLEVEGSLGFVHVCPYVGRSIHLWILADKASWCWILRFKLEIFGNPKATIYPISGIQGGEMLIDCGHGRLFAVNVETRRVRKIDISISYLRHYMFLNVTSYKISFVGVNRLASFI